MAARVAEKSHTIQGQNVEVKLYTPPKPRPTYPNKLLLQNVKENTTKDCLTMFLENIAGLEPKEILFGDEPGIVLITFEEEPGKTVLLWSSYLLLLLSMLLDMIVYVESSGFCFYGCCVVAIGNFFDGKNLSP